ncbi:MAG: MoaD/ThiS family protein [Flavobacteriales bacterium]|nr:MoaD/ThiS family protein [Flavobacteriales bacterium]MCB9446932.1 MoaD/ThiS family protein [Flavobacteriales bacterium]
MAKLIIPTPLRKFTDNQSSYVAEGQTVKEAVAALTRQYPEVANHLLDENGNIRSFINIFVGDENILALQKEQTPVSADSVVSIVPAIAGGSR